MRLATLAPSLLLAFVAATAAAQTPTAPPPATQSGSPTASPDLSPAFEVATIKPSAPDNCCARTFSVQGRRFNSHNTTLRYLMQYAYRFQPHQLVGGPAWFDDARFDVSGQLEGEGQPTLSQWQLALQNLLTDRFQLKLHHESKELPAYVLTIAKGGAKLTKSDGDPSKIEGASFSGPIGGTMNGYGRNVTLVQFIGELQRVALDRPVVDRTGITGIYNLQLTFTRDDPQGLAVPPPPADNAPPPVFTAIEEQLGLKLTPAKAPVDVLVIDHAEMPSQN